MVKILFAATALMLGSISSATQAGPADDQIFAAAKAVQPKVVSWRRDIHQHPELSNQEARTGALVARHIRSLGLEVREGGAGHGVIGVLRGTKPGRTIILRADMDALPVAERTGLPFASRATASWVGATVPVMHACGHDTHVAMLMGAAEILSTLKSQFAGTVVFLFQPAEEGPPEGESGGAPLIVEQKLLASFSPDAILGLHVLPGESGSLSWRTGPFMAAADAWELSVEGLQTHGAMPWLGIDAASVSAEIVTSFNQIAARQVNVAHSPSVLSVGQIKLGARHNIIPAKFEMAGTLRTFDPASRKLLLDRVDAALRSIETKYGAKVSFRLTASLPVTSNDRALADRLAVTLSRASEGKIDPAVNYVMGSEDFARYAEVAPTFFYHLGIGASPANHSPDFTVDERALETGVRAHVLTALDLLASGPVRDRAPGKAPGS